MSLEDEAPGFEEWLGHHAAAAAGFGLVLSVPKHGTSYRSNLARIFRSLLDEGYDLEEMGLASLGVLSDEYMRTGGWFKPENVLRKDKIGGRVDAGRAHRASAATPGKYDHLD